MGNIEVLPWAVTYRRIDVPELFGADGREVAHVDHRGGTIFVSTLVGEDRAGRAFVAAEGVAKRELSDAMHVRLVPLLTSNAVLRAFPVSLVAFPAPMKARHP